MKSTAVFPSDALPYRWVDPARNEAYMRDPRHARWGVGRLFSALESIEGSQIVSAGLVHGAESGKSVEWHSSHHAIDDAYSILEAIAREHRWPSESLPEIRSRPPLEKESPIRMFRRLARRVLLRRRDVPRERPGGKRWLVSIALSTEQTHHLIENRMPSAAVFTPVFAALADHFGLKRSCHWMVTTQARHLVDSKVEATDSRLHSSYFLVDIVANASYETVQRIFLEKLQSRDADANWILGNRICHLPYFLLVALSWLDLKLFNRDLIGGFSYVGAVAKDQRTDIERILWHVPTRRTRPILVLAQICAGRLSVSVNLHPILGLDESEARALGDKIEGALTRA